MRIYLDTEFIEDEHGIDLISIGLVREDGKELYLINRECDWKRVLADDWLSRNVVPHLPAMGDPCWEYASSIRTKVWEFCCHPIRYTHESRGGVGIYKVPHPTTPDFWADWAAYDWVVLCRLYGRMVNLPQGFPMYCNDFQQLIAGTGFVPEEPKTTHDALEDARCLRDNHLKFLSGTSATMLGT